MLVVLVMDIITNVVDQKLDLEGVWTLKIVLLYRANGGAIHRIEQGLTRSTDAIWTR